MFVNPVDDTMEGMEDYYTRIRKPMTLGQIQGNLLTNEYSSIKELRYDFSLVHTNTEKFFGRNSYYAMAAKELRDSFEKMLSTLKEETFKNWSKKVMKLEKELYQEIDDASEKIQKYSPTRFVFPKLPQMDVTTIKSFIKASNELCNKKDAHEFLQIVLRYHPNLGVHSKSVEIDLDNLCNEAVWAVYAYSQKRFLEDQKEYPVVNDDEQESTKK
ncbi:Bromodomain containing protein [Histomonas meleagridis]|uniref:Bromodomain containing protein n=1 Tax=Histomonas meleagridis TaxID=135588 RepID=UPI003559ED66|nr:Bromodomain containing protein [Histomonas meleagridis]KAH0806946.1 Bromodomain containing protein [Histomonas meleagridis]